MCAWTRFSFWCQMGRSSRSDFWIRNAVSASVRWNVRGPEVLCGPVNEITAEHIAAFAETGPVPPSGRHGPSQRRRPAVVRLHLDVKQLGGARVAPQQSPDPLGNSHRGLGVLPTAGRHLLEALDDASLTPVVHRPFFVPARCTPAHDEHLITTGCRTHLRLDTRPHSLPR